MQVDGDMHGEHKRLEMTLAPEALWGEAQSLYALGRAAEARRSLSMLLQRYPDSAYAGAARAKLESRSNQP